MALPLVDLEKHSLHFLGSGHVFKLHLDEAESAAPLRLPVSHHDGIGDRTILLEVVDHVRLLCDEGQTAYK